jgi:hypothetical protein
MKKILVVVVALASMNAFATRARVNALGNSPHLIDTQTVYSNPADMMMMGDYVTMESGVTGAAAANGNAEGMVTRSMGDSKMGLALGHQSSNASAWSLRALAGFTTMKSQQNPVEFSYGMKSSDMSWAATLVYSNYNDKKNSEKESSMGIRTGLRMGALDAKLNLGLMNTYENAVDGKFKGNMGITAGAGYAMDNLYVSGEATMVGFKAENISGTGTKDFTATTIKASAVSSHKKDGNEFFYGAGLTSESRKEKVADSTTTNMTLPVWMGLEVDAASWLTLRGSVAQNTLINSSKVETAGTTTTETAPGANSTTASVGAGMKFNKLTLDGSLTGLTGVGQSQEVSGNALLGQVGVTYMF